MPKISLIADPGQNVARGLKWIISSLIVTGIRTPDYFFFIISPSSSRLLLQF